MLRKRRGGQTKKIQESEERRSKGEQGRGGVQARILHESEGGRRKNTTKKGGERCCESTLGNKIT